MGVASNLFYSTDTETQTLHRRITPTDEQFEDQQSRWNELANSLLPSLKEKSERDVKTWLQGSYKFATQIRPMNSKEEFDIDLGFYILWEADEDKYSCDEIREFVRSALEEYAEDCDDIIGEIKIKDKCFRIPYNGGFHIDTPTYHLDEKQDKRLLASRGGWEDSDPKAIYNWYKKLFDDDQRNIVKRQIRYLKAWAAIHMENGRRPSSILLTILAAEAANGENLDKNLGDDGILKIISKSIHDRLQKSTEVYNPINSNEDLNRLSQEDMSDFIYKLDGLVDIANRANDAENEMEAADIWSEAFQHFFPFPETSTEAIMESAGLPSLILPEIQVTAKAKDNPNAKPFVGMNQIGPIPKNCDITFEITNIGDLPIGSSIKWIVRNVGSAAENVNDLGHSAGTGYRAQERSAYRGIHYMDCIVRRHDRFIMMRRVPVIISNNTLPPRNPDKRPNYVQLRGRR